MIRRLSIICVIVVISLSINGIVFSQEDDADTLGSANITTQINVGTLMTFDLPAGWVGIHQGNAAALRNQILYIYASQPLDIPSLAQGLGAQGGGMIGYYAVLSQDADLAQRFSGYFGLLTNGGTIPQDALESIETRTVNGVDLIFTETIFTNARGGDAHFVFAAQETDTLGLLHVGVTYGRPANDLELAGFLNAAASSMLVTVEEGTTTFPVESFKLGLAFDVDLGLVAAVDDTYLTGGIPVLIIFADDGLAAITTNQGTLDDLDVVFSTPQGSFELPSGVTADVEAKSRNGVEYIEEVYSTFPGWQTVARAIDDDLTMTMRIFTQDGSPVPDGLTNILLDAFVDATSFAPAAQIDFADATIRTIDIDLPNQHVVPAGGYSYRYPDEAGWRVDNALESDIANISIANIDQFSFAAGSRLDFNNEMAMLITAQNPFAGIFSSPQLANEFVEVSLISVFTLTQAQLGDSSLENIAVNGVPMLVLQGTTISGDAIAFIARETENGWFVAQPILSNIDIDTALAIVASIEVE